MILQLNIFLLFNRLRIWDTRLAPNKANMLTISDAHDNDINVINWNKKDPLIVSGGDDGKLMIWDLRQFKVYTFIFNMTHK
jgi:ribosome assembly protein RRB1